MAPLLEIDNLHTEIRMKQATVHAVDGVSLHIDPGETLGVVGESGCGKTMTALSIMNLLPVGGHIVGGSITLRFQFTLGGRCRTMKSSASWVGGVHAPPCQPRKIVAQTGSSSRPIRRMNSRFQYAPV